MERPTVIRFALLLLLSLSAAASSPYTLEFEELAPGVWAGIRPESTRIPVMGSTTFVVSDVGVVVFDGGGAAGAADQVIAKIRSLTDAPVTHVAISHWHGDHCFGIHRYVEEWPNVQILARGAGLSATQLDITNCDVRVVTPVSRGGDMITYRHPGGGEVFGAPSVAFSGALFVDPVASRVLENVLRRFLRPPTRLPRTPLPR